MYYQKPTQYNLPRYGPVRWGCSHEGVRERPCVLRQHGMSDIDYSRVSDAWIGFALQQRRSGTIERALQAYDGAFKRFADTAHSVKLFCACTLLDLVKAFDSVPFDWLEPQAKRYNYNMWMLCLSIAAYMLGRALCIDGCCSVFVGATQLH